MTARQRLRLMLALRWAGAVGLVAALAWTKADSFKDVFYIVFVAFYCFSLGLDFRSRDRRP
jgi:hypothetical protein